MKFAEGRSLQGPASFYRANLQRNYHNAAVHYIAFQCGIGGLGSV